MSTRSPTITLTGLSAAAPDGHSLFNNLDLSFGPERTGLVGRNGTGKTTLLELIAGSREPLRLHPATRDARLSPAMAGHAR